MQTDTRRQTLEQRLAAVRRAIANYEELESDQGDPEYVARGNGFCDSKYSEDFLEGQLQRLRQEEADLQQQLEDKTIQ
ncbi:MAG: hypothetical protein K5864_09555 [Bacteroidales bacterium]|nr:hypothetical protein [Bacteroidales bacterium]